MVSRDRWGAIRCKDRSRCNEAAKTRVLSCFFAIRAAPRAPAYTSYYTQCVRAGHSALDPAALAAAAAASANARGTANSVSPGTSLLHQAPAAPG